MRKMGKKRRTEVRGSFSYRKAESMFQHIINEEVYKFLVINGRETFKMGLK